MTQHNVHGRKVIVHCKGREIRASRQPHISRDGRAMTRTAKKADGKSRRTNPWRGIKSVLAGQIDPGRADKKKTMNVIERETKKSKQVSRE